MNVPPAAYFDLLDREPNGYATSRHHVSTVVKNSEDRQPTAGLQFGLSSFLKKHILVTHTLVLLS